MFTIEMRMTSRHGKSAYIFQHANVVRLQDGREIGEVARGMPNCKDGGHESILLDAKAVIYNAENASAPA